MSTGMIDTWSVNMTEVGPLYPFVGTEFFWFIVCFVLWIIWHIVQIRMENRTYEHEVERYGDTETLKRLIKMETPENP